MLQIKLPVRAYKKLIYLASVSSFLCFLALHLTISYQRDHLPYELSDVNDHNGGPQGQVFRGLLQKTPVDYPNVAIPTGVGGSSSSSSSSAAAAAAASLLLLSSPSTNTNNKSQPSRFDPTKSSSTLASLSNQLSTSPNSIASALGSASANGDGPLISTLSLSTNIIHDHSKFNGYGEDISHYLDAEPQVDNVPVLGESQLLMELENQSKINNNNLALSYWLKARKYPKAKQNISNNNNSKTCRVEFPNLYELEYNNIYWQKFPTINGTFYLYGAYYDNRWRGGPLPMVRILAMIDRVQPPPTLCQIWFDRISVPIISPATYIYGWYSKWGNYKDGFLQPYIVTCKIPRIKGLPKDFYPTSVSLVENRCQKASNNLRIINNRPAQKQEFAVCVKGLDFLHEDLSVRLVEWIELLRLLGANKIFLYDLEVHPNITKVLDFYQQDGLVELTKITLPGHQPNLPGFRHLYLKNKLTHKRQNELIPYNDCLYRNLYSYNYVALLDIDEVIMPLKHSNWSELMKEVQNMSLKEKNYTRASYNVRNVYFLDDLNHDEEQMRHEAHEIGIPRYLHMLQHVYRSQNYTKPGQYVKCFHNTERVVSLHNHFPLNCFGTCTTYSIPVELAHLQHYRKDCVGPLKKSCKEFRQYTTRDTTIFRYKDELVQRTTHVLKTLGFFGPDQQQQHSNQSPS